MSRLTEEDVNRELDADFQKFNASKYDGNVPEKLIELFKDALFQSDPNSHQLHVSKIRELFIKKDEDLTFFEAGLMINIILRVPLSRLYEDVYIALNRMEELEKFTIEFNAKVANFKEMLSRKKDAKMRIIAPAPTNGMKIIRNN